MAKMRLDQLLVERGLADTRSQAAAMVMAGEVSSEGRRLDKPGMPVSADLNVELKERPRYVSRGGDKLASVFDALGLQLAEKTVLDVGASTGGFTDFALQHGAKHVYAVDVGTGQLHSKLRQDPRVTVLERTDIRSAKLPLQPDIAVIDVSFISLIQVLAPVSRLIKPGAPIVAMAKPQFEAGKKIADKYHGVIDDEAVRSRILSDFESQIAGDFEIIKSQDSAVTGAQGNRERFYLLEPKQLPS